MPASGDTATISAGTVSATSVVFAGVGVTIVSAAASGGTLTLINSAIQANASITAVNTNAYGSGTNTNVNVQGTVTNSGTLGFNGSVTFMQISGSGGSASGTLVNAGLISLVDSSLQIQPASGSTTPTLTNNGTIAVTNPDNVFQSPVFNATINGTGTISVGAKAKLDLAGSVGSGQTLTFTGGVGAGAVVQVDTPASFSPTISQFVSGDTITITNTPYTSASYTSTSASSGVLSLFNGSTLTGSLNLSGIYSLGTFSFSYVQLDSTHSTLAITTSVTNASSGATSSGSVGAVYRFFDNKYGTHFFTADAGERNTVLATRTDLVQEINGFGDVTSTSTGATAVYRFFDTTYGTHFFTASATERDNTIATRTGPTGDLTYEPASTFYEHSTQQAGDVPVYRFFDKNNGTHFYTGDTTEYNGIITPSSPTYRGDLKFESIEFYAPAGSFK